MTRTLAVSVKPSRPRESADGALAAAENQAAEAGEALLEADRRLIARCLDGDESGWRDLYDYQNPHILRALRQLLGPRASDEHLVVELAARVWFALVRHEGRLLRNYDPARQHSLAAYLAGLSRIEVLRHLRSEGRRRAHEWRRARSGRNDEWVDGWQVQAIIDDLVTTLTPSERECLEGQLSAALDDEASDTPLQQVSESNVWQRRHRIRAKIRSYFRET